MEAQVTHKFIKRMEQLLDEKLRIIKEESKSNLDMIQKNLTIILEEIKFIKHEQLKQDVDLKQLSLAAKLTSLIFHSIEQPTYQERLRKITGMLSVLNECEAQYDTKQLKNKKKNEHLEMESEKTDDEVLFDSKKEKKEKHETKKLKKKKKKKHSEMESNQTDNLMLFDSIEDKEEKCVTKKLKKKYLEIETHPTDDIVLFDCVKDKEEKNETKNLKKKEKKDLEMESHEKGNFMLVDSIKDKEEKRETRKLKMKREKKYLEVETHQTDNAIMFQSVKDEEKQETKELKKKKELEMKLYGHVVNKSYENINEYNLSNIKGCFEPTNTEKGAYQSNIRENEGYFDSVDNANELNYLQIKEQQPSCIRGFKRKRQKMEKLDAGYIDVSFVKPDKNQKDSCIEELSLNKIKRCKTTYFDDNNVDEYGESISINDKSTHYDFSYLNDENEQKSMRQMEDTEVQLDSTAVLSDKNEQNVEILKYDYQRQNVKCKPYVKTNSLAYFVNLIAEDNKKQKADRPANEEKQDERNNDTNSDDVVWINDTNKNELNIVDQKRRKRKRTRKHKSKKKGDEILEMPIQTESVYQYKEWTLEEPMLNCTRTKSTDFDEETKVLDQFCDNKFEDEEEEEIILKPFESYTTKGISSVYACPKNYSFTPKINFSNDNKIEIVCENKNKSAFDQSAHSKTGSILLSDSKQNYVGNNIKLQTQYHEHSYENSRQTDENKNDCDTSNVFKHYGIIYTSNDKISNSHHMNVNGTLCKVDNFKLETSQIEVKNGNEFLETNVEKKKKTRVRKRKSNSKNTNITQRNTNSKLRNPNSVAYFVDLLAESTKMLNVLNTNKPGKNREVPKSHVFDLSYPKDDVEECYYEFRNETTGLDHSTTEDNVRGYFDAAYRTNGLDLSNVNENVEACYESTENANGLYLSNINRYEANLKSENTNGLDLSKIKDNVVGCFYSADKENDIDQLVFKEQPTKS